VSEAKYYATKVSWEAMNVAMQILGGIGYTQVYPVERMLRGIAQASYGPGATR